MKRSAARHRSLLFYFATFFLTGMATVLVGVCLALGSAPLSDDSVGRLLAAQFCGQLAGSLLLGKHDRRWFFTGLAVAALAAAALAALHSLSLPLLFVYGVGLGLTMGSTNTLLALESPPEERVRRMELLNVFWPLGAATCAWMLPTLHARRGPAIAFAALAVAFMLLFGLGFASGAGTRVQEEQVAADDIKAGDRKQKLTLLVEYALPALLVVGAETGLANWLPSFQQRSSGGYALAVPLATLFWVSILVGRIAAALAAKLAWFHRVLRMAPLAGAAGTVLLVCVHSKWALFVAVIVTSLALGPLYPQLLVVAARSKWKGFVFFSAGVGSALVPWLIGKVSTASDSLRAAMLLCAACCLAFYALQRPRGAQTPSEPGSGSHVC